MILTIIKILFRMCLLTAVFFTTIFLMDRFDANKRLNISSPLGSIFEKKEVNVGYTESIREDGTIDIFLTDKIGHMKLYIPLVRMFKRLDSSDTVVIHMANYGGSVQSGSQIINAMRISKAKMIVELEGPSYSMGAIITCAADEIIVHPHTYLMFHTFSTRMQGKGSDMITQLAAMNKLMNDMFIQECVTNNILSMQQVRTILLGGDVYIHADQLLDATGVSPR